MSQCFFKLGGLTEPSQPPPPPPPRFLDLPQTCEITWALEMGWRGMVSLTDSTLSGPGLNPWLRSLFVFCGRHHAVETGA